MSDTLETFRSGPVSDNTHLQTTRCRVIWLAICSVHTRNDFFPVIYTAATRQRPFQQPVRVAYPCGVFSPSAAVSTATEVRWWPLVRRLWSLRDASWLSWHPPNVGREPSKGLASSAETKSDARVATTTDNISSQVTHDFGTGLLLSLHWWNRND